MGGLHSAKICLMRDGIQAVGLIGTRFTMEQDFYKGRLSDRFGLQVIVPNGEDQSTIHEIIYTELCQGMIKDSSRNQYLRILQALHQQGAEAVIPGCTEIALLVQQSHKTVPLYDTTEIHAREAVVKSEFRGGQVKSICVSLDEVIFTCPSHIVTRHK